MRNFKPEEMYRYIPLNEREVTNCYIQKTPVTAIVEMADPTREEFTVRLSDTLIGHLPFEEASIQDLKLITINKSGEKANGIDAVTLVGKKIRVIITSVPDEFSLKSKILVSRKRNMLNFLEELSDATEVECKVISMAYFGIFCDIGEGIIACNYITELSKSRYTEISNWIIPGDTIFAIITEIDKTRIKISRKKYYEKYLEEFLKSLSRGQVLMVKASGALPDGTGYFVEVTPGVSGIINARMNIQEGDDIKACIRSVDIDKRQIRLNEIVLT